ncbi:MAG: TIGR00366 family protein, partial [Croceimicrobium sp.]
HIPGLPERIAWSETIFSSMNLWASLLLLILVPAFFYSIAGRVPKKLEVVKPPQVLPNLERATGAEKIDRSPLFGRIIGALILVVAILQIFSSEGLQFLNPNFINLSLLGFALIFHGSLYSFADALDDAIRGASGILLQFPLYFGIMGLMRDGGLIEGLSTYFGENASAFSFPLWTFLSAGIINIFVPSGGGQWAIQGPVILETAQLLGIPYGKAIMAMAYGDQLTNMLQPFWALPLLGITGLKARRIVPYTLALMGLGGLIFLSLLIIF